MAPFLNPITSCLNKNMSVKKSESTDLAERCKEEYPSDSKTSPTGLLWKVSSSLYNVGSGAVGAGVGSVKWVASTTYSVGSGVVAATQNAISKVGLPIPKCKPKNKEE